MSELTPNLPPEEEEGEGEEEERGEGEMLGGNVEVDHTPLQDQLARNKECKYFMKLNFYKVLAMHTNAACASQILNDEGQVM